HTFVAPRRSRGAPRSPASGPELAPQTPTRSSRPGAAVARLGHPRAAPNWPPKPPHVRRAPAQPWRASVTRERPRTGPPNPHTFVAPRRSRGAPRSPASGPELAPKPTRSSRPGAAVARLGHPRLRAPAHFGGGLVVAEAEEDGVAQAAVARLLHEADLPDQ